MKYDGERVVPDDMHDSVANYQRHLVRYVFAMSFCGRRRVLDAACGAGYGTALLADAAEKVLGVDVSEQAIDYARDRYRKSIHKNCSYSVANLDEYEIGNARWDTIVSFETIEHLERPADFLKRIRQGLVKNGLFVGSLPINSPGEYHRHVYSVDEAMTLVQSSGMQCPFVLGQHELNLLPLDAKGAPYIVFVCQNT